MAKPSIFILDGPDSSGKSTIAKALSNALDFPLYGSTGASHFDGTDSQLNFALDLAFGETKLAEFIEHLSGKYRPQFNLVRDRSWVSELIYAKVFGRTTYYEVIEELDRIYSENFNTLLVVCVKDDYGSIDDFDPIIENHSKIDAAYRELFDETTNVCENLRVPRILLNTTDQDLNYQIETIDIAFQNFHFN